MLLAGSNFQHFSLQQLVLRDITCDGRGADYGAVRVLERRDAQRNVDPLAVLADSRRLEVLDVLSDKKVEADATVEATVRGKVKQLISRFPIYQD